MESHLVRIIDRLQTMGQEGGALKRQFERDGEPVAEVTFSRDDEQGVIFKLRNISRKEVYTFDSIDLVAMEIYELIY